MALVELGQGRGRARVVRELGDPALAADVIDAMLADRDLRVGFGRRIEGEAADAAVAARDLAFDRRDLRDLPTFTVDPASAHDFDDAVSASRTERGFRLWIHIADVAAHVRPGGALEKEARRRANSTYVPGRVAPMLPEVLSSDVCSLVPNEDRLAVTSEIEISESGEALSASFYRSLIRSESRI
jgi:ribonuclease R